MGNNSKYVQGWLNRRAQPETGKPTQKSFDTSDTPKVIISGTKPPEVERPVRPTLPGAAPLPPAIPATGASRAGYRSEPDNIWHPSPSAKKFLEHIADCATCKAEADKLGLKAE